MENKYVKVRGINNKQIVELPLNFDNTLSVAVLRSQFPYATGLKYTNSKTNQIRSIRRSGDRFFLSGDVTWNDYIFYCSCSPIRKMLLLNPNDVSVIPRKRKSVNSLYGKFPKTFDLMAMGLSYDTTEEGLNNYLNRFGPTMYCNLHFDESLKLSRGIAYFRFSEIRAQNLCLSAVHVVDKTKIIIKIPTEKINVKDIQSHKLYISNVSTTLTREDLRAYFSQYGNVIHVFMPPNKRNFAFVTFIDKSSIERAWKDGQTHIFNGARVNINLVVDKPSSTIHKEAVQAMKRKIEQITEPPKVVKNSNLQPPDNHTNKDETDINEIKKRKLSQNIETSVAVESTKQLPHVCPLLLESHPFQQLNSPASQIQSPLNGLITTPNFSQPPPFFINSSIPPPDLPPIANCATPIYHQNIPLSGYPRSNDITPPNLMTSPNVITSPNVMASPNVMTPPNFMTPPHFMTPPNFMTPPHFMTSPNFMTAQNIMTAPNVISPPDVMTSQNVRTVPNEYNQSNQFHFQNTSLSPTISLKPTQMESQTRRIENDLGLNFNSNTFQSLVLKEIMSQFQEQCREKLKLEKYHSKSRKSSSTNRIQLESLVNQVCLLKHENSQLKNKIPHHNRFKTSQSEIAMLHHNKTDIPSLTDPNVHKALELLQNSRVVDVLMKLSRTNMDNQMSDN